MRTLLVCLLIVVATTAFAQLERTTLVNTALSDAGVTATDFIIGIGSADKQDPNAHALARERAVKAVFDQLSGRIRNVILASKNRPGGGHQNVAAHYSTVAQTPSVVVELPRIVDIPLPPGAHNSYVVVAVDRQELIDFYARKAGTLRTEIDAILNDPLLAGNPTYTAKQYLGTYARYEALKEAEMIMLGADAALTPGQIFQTLQRHATEQHDAIYNVDRYFESQYPVTDVQSIAQVISAQLTLQAASPAARVQLDPFTYDISEIPSQFSVSLGNALEQALTVQWATFTPPGPSTPAVHPLGFGRNITSRLSGTFWGLGNKITVRATLRDVMTGEFQAAAVVKFNKNLRNLNASRYAPLNYEYVVDTLVADAESQLASGFGKALRQSVIRRPSTGPPPTGDTVNVVVSRPESPPQHTTRPHPWDTPAERRDDTSHPDSGFTVDLRTDRPDRGNYFYIGERTAVYVRVNRPAYYRLGYGFADGRYAILRDNEYIDASQVNKWVKVPGTLVFTDPEGSESLRVVAQETELPAIETYTEGRNRFLRGSKPNAEVNVRGIGQARSNMVAMRGGFMEDDDLTSLDFSDPEVNVRGAYMLAKLPASTEAQLIIVTAHKFRD